MKLLFLLFFLVALIFHSPLAEAINGNNLIGFGPESRAMGGVGIGQPIGVDSVLKNPAFIRAQKKVDVLIGVTQLYPTVKVENKNANLIGATRKEVESEADVFTVPAFGISKNINEHWAYGIGAFGVSGLGVDFRDARANGVFALATDLNLFKIAPGVSYNKNNFYAGANLSVLHGKFALAYSTDATNFTSPGASTDTNIGYDLGLGYNWKNFWAGINYQSAISLDFSHQLIEAAIDFGLTDVFLGNRLEQPAELGIGVAYKKEKLRVGIEVKKIFWEDAQTFQQAGWEDQTVFAFGAGYRIKSVEARLGFNYAKHPLGDRAIKNPTSTASNNRDAVNLFNLVAFPGTPESHITLGAGWYCSDDSSIDLAFVLAPEVKEKTNFDSGTGSMEYEMKHSEKSVTVGLNYRY